MASGGSSGRAASASSSFDFGSDDVLCSYDDYATQGPSIGKRPAPPGKDLHESRVGRPLVSIYDQEEYSKESMISCVEKCMKKYADNLLQPLEGISGRLARLEIYCYKLERSLGEFRADFIQDQSGKDMKFKSLEKNVQEVHRSVQILRDKQELAEAQKELAKLQLVQKESTEKNENGVMQSVSDLKNQDDMPHMANHQLALALTHQTAAQAVLPAGASQQIQPYRDIPVQQQAPVPPSIQQDQIIMNQAGKYYPQHQPLPQDQHSQPMQSKLHYVQPRPQLQDIPVQAPPQQPLIVNQNQPPSFPQYQQQLRPQPNQQLPQLAVQPQQPASQAQIRAQAPSYPPYPPQPVNPAPETFSGSMPMQVPHPPVAHPRPEVVPYGYGGTGSSVSQLPLHHNIQQPMQAPVSQNSFGSQLSKGGHMGSATYPAPSYNSQSYNSAYSYAPSNLPAARNQQLPPTGNAALHCDSQLMRNHPYGEMIEKAISMGYDRNQVISIVQRMVESGQPLDFNSLLDRLNGQAAGAPGRAW